MMRRKSLRERFGVLGRRLAYRVQRHLLRSRYLVARERRFGLRFRFKTEDAIGRHIYQYGFYEEALTRFLLEDLTLRSGEVVVDAGANIGWYAALLDRAAPEDVRIYAFEPEPLNFELLTENLELNGCTGVVPVRKALADRVGRRPLFVYPDKNRGRHTFHETPDAAEMVEVATTTLDRFWRERDLDGRPLGLLKIDVEGFEHRVLEGAAGVLDRCRVVTTEYAPALMRRGDEKPERLLAHLRGFGFEPHRVGPDGVEAVGADELEDPDEPVDLIWTRGSVAAADTG